MSDSSVREWCRKFRGGRTDVHDEGGQGRRSTVTDELLQKFDLRVRGNRRFKISNFPKNFHKFRGAIFYRIVMDRFGLPHVLYTVRTKTTD